jgi:hypothetical protein
MTQLINYSVELIAAFRCSGALPNTPNPNAFQPLIFLRIRVQINNLTKHNRRKPLNHMFTGITIDPNPEHSRESPPKHLLQPLQHRPLRILTDKQQIPPRRHNSVSNIGPRNEQHPHSDHFVAVRVGVGS